jgi:vacuolar-type H+-ATPase subunit E/Vma4
MTNTPSTNKNTTGQTNNLFVAIQEQTNKDIVRMQAESDAKCAKMQAVAKAELAKIADDAKASLETRIQQMTKMYESRTSMELRHIEMKWQEHISMHIHQLVADQLAKDIQHLDYIDTCIQWITEGAMALAVDALVINASLQEKNLLTPQVLAQVTQHIKDKTGKVVQVTLSPDMALNEQGIVISSMDGTIQFYNTIHARLARYKTQITKYIATCLADTGEKH